MASKSDMPNLAEGNERLGNSGDSRNREEEVIESQERETIKAVRDQMKKVDAHSFTHYIDEFKRLHEQIPGLRSQRDADLNCPEDVRSSVNEMTRDCNQKKRELIALKIIWDKVQERSANREKFFQNFGFIKNSN